MKHLDWQPQTEIVGMWEKQRTEILCYELNNKDDVGRDVCGVKVVGISTHEYSSSSDMVIGF